MDDGKVEVHESIAGAVVQLLPVNNNDSGCNVVLQPPFYHGQHIRYITRLAVQLDSVTSYEGAMTEHLKMSGVYWLLTALSLLESSTEVERDVGLVHAVQKKMMMTTKIDSSVNDDDSSSKEDKDRIRMSIVDWVFTCYDTKSGGFGGNTGHDGHLLYTLSAVQILALADRLNDDRLNRNAVVNFCSGLQLPDGSFTGDGWGEVDTRFTYCALSTLSILHSLHAVDVPKAAEYILQCRNLDGGFGAIRGGESHAGQVFCSIGALSIAQQLHSLVQHDAPSADLLGWWLAERQVDSGGLNGRPEKQADVCYSWWILSVLSILGKVSWINKDKLATFILKCQDDEDGGIADRPEDMADIFHTFFGIAGLSLLGHLHNENNNNEDRDTEVLSCSYRKIDPVYALPTDVVKRLGLQAQVLAPNDSSTEAIDERLSRYNILQVQVGKGI